MSPAEEVARDLDVAADADEFPARSRELTTKWAELGFGIEVVEPILQFMESHPAIDYGMPGALVHFVEDFYHAGYEERLIASVERRPTEVTVWMLNRLINGPEEPSARSSLRRVLEGVVRNPQAGEGAIEAARMVLERAGQAESK